MGRYLLVSLALILTACGRRNEPASAPYLSVEEAERAYGHLITVGNHPTADQHGTGERLGFFQDGSGTVWGLPITITNDGSVLACAPPLLRERTVTDTFPSGFTILGSTNEPTGWRGGTGNLELLLRDSRGVIRSQAVRGAPIPSGPACRAPLTPGPPQELYYYRLVPGGSRTY
jgi:hypothetical protein